MVDFFEGKRDYIELGNIVQLGKRGLCGVMHDSVASCVSALVERDIRWLMISKVKGHAISRW
jgi:hypothetical protein